MKIYELLCDYKKRVVIKPFNILLIMLLGISMILFLIRFLGFRIIFMPVADVFICLLLSAIVLTLTIFEIKIKRDKRQKSSNESVGIIGGKLLVTNYGEYAQIR